MPKYFKEKEIKGLSPILVAKLDTAREIAGIPFIITSGKRTFLENSFAGGVDDSSHLNGLAVDIRCRDINSRFDIMRGLLGAGICRIGLYTTHIHADIDKTKPQNLIYLY
jgi:zinc D-Ala-D-Ala carboxypeptidase